jgi:hypothetical protein
VRVVAYISRGRSLMRELSHGTQLMHKVEPWEAFDAHRM